MRYKTLVLLPVVIAAAACAKGKAANTASNDDLKRDLALASAPKLELASAQKSFQRTDIVSGIEKIASSAPQGHTALVNKPKAHEPAPAPVVASTEPAPEVVAMTPEPAPAQAPAAVVPVAGPRPTAPTSITVDATEARGEGQSGGGGGWGGIGSVIGVVIRGGGVDGDHCDPRTDGRRRGGIFVNDRLPGGMGGMGGMTFPRR